MPDLTKGGNGFTLMQTQVLFFTRITPADSLKSGGCYPRVDYAADNRVLTNLHRYPASLGVFFPRTAGSNKGNSSAQGVCRESPGPSRRGAPSQLGFVRSA